MSYKYMVVDSSGAEPVQSTLENAVSAGKGNAGAVTQITSKATTVVLNTQTGAITLNNASLASDTAVSFTFTNSQIKSTDIILFAHTSGGTAGAYTVTCFPGAGTATVTIQNVTAGSLSEAIVITFTILRSGLS